MLPLRIEKITTAPKRGQLAVEFKDLAGVVRSVMVPANRIRSFNRVRHEIFLAIETWVSHVCETGSRGARKLWLDEIDAAMAIGGAN